MCSSPKPKASVKGKRTKGTNSGLSSLSPEARSRFTQRANEAQERRYQIQKEKAQQRANLTSTVTAKNKHIIKHKNQNTLNYWLLHANLKEVMYRIFGGKANKV